jgi:bud site selection protein 20
VYNLMVSFVVHCAEPLLACAGGQRRLFERNKADQLYKATTSGTYELPVDDELPGRGQNWCSVTGRHFESKAALEQHRKSKAYKRTCAQHNCKAVSASRVRPAVTSDAQ